MKKLGLLLVSSLLIVTLLNCQVDICVDAQSNQGLEIVEIGKLETAGFAANVQVRGDVAFVSASEAGLYIVNISDPAHPTEMSRYNTSIDHIHGFYLDENLVYFADYTQGLKILDISDLGNPTLIGQFHDGGEAGTFDVCEGLAFLADYEDGLEIVNITDPTNPQELYQYNTDISLIFNVVVNNDLAYVSDYISASEKALRILNVSDLSSIEEIAEHTIDGEIFCIEFAGDIAYMMCSYGGVKVFNISNPNTLVEMGSYYDGGHAVDSGLFEDYLIVADKEDGVEILDISDVTNLTEASHYFDGGSATNVEVIGDLIYVADGDDGLEILQIERETTSTSTTNTESMPITYFLIIIGISGIVVLVVVVFIRSRR